MLFYFLFIAGLWLITLLMLFMHTSFKNHPNTHHKNIPCPLPSSHRSSLSTRYPPSHNSVLWSKSTVLLLLALRCFLCIFKPHSIGEIFIPFLDWFYLDWHLLVLLMLSKLHDFVLSYICIVFHCEYITQLLVPFIHSWALGCPYLGYGIK